MMTALVLIGGTVVIIALIVLLLWFLKESDCPFEMYFVADAIGQLICCVLTAMVSAIESGSSND